MLIKRVVKKHMMNFKIIENAQPDYLSKFDEFIELYNMGIYKVEAIIKMLGWTRGDYNHAYKHAREEGLLNQSNLMPKKADINESKHPKYYSKSNGGYVVVRQKKGVKIYFGKYSTEVEARLAVSYFKENGWDKRRLWEVKQKVCEDIGKIKDGEY